MSGKIQTIISLTRGTIFKKNMRVHLHFKFNFPMVMKIKKASVSKDSKVVIFTISLKKD